VRRLVGAASKDHKSAIDIEIYFTATSKDTEDLKAAGEFLQRLDEPEKAPHALQGQEVQDASDSSSQDDLQPSYDIHHLQA
jgi:hypothetical protein